MPLFQVRLCLCVLYVMLSSFFPPPAFLPSLLPFARLIYPAFPHYSTSSPSFPSFLYFPSSFPSSYVSCFPRISSASLPFHPSIHTFPFPFHHSIIRPSFLSFPSSFPSPCVSCFPPISSFPSILHFFSLILFILASIILPSTFLLHFPLCFSFLSSSLLPCFIVASFILPCTSSLSSFPSFTSSLPHL